MNFADRLSARVTERQSQLVLGLDPEPTRLLPTAGESVGGDTARERAARAVSAHCGLLIDALGEVFVAVKLQLACFERLGAPGWQALASVAGHARQAGMLVIADGKRGDVPHTASAYAQALVGATATPWGEVEGLGADAVTANPLLGRDALAPIVDAGRAAGAGTFVLVRTSNPGASELQDAACGREPALHTLLARITRELGEIGVGECGLSDVGAVVGATEPELLDALRSQMPYSIFLLPGVGAQGGRIESLAPAFEPGPQAGLIAVSRTISEAALAGGQAKAARSVAEQLRKAAWDLSGG